MYRILNEILVEDREHTRYIFCPRGGYSLLREIESGAKIGFSNMCESVKYQGYKPTPEVINDPSSVV